MFTICLHDSVNLPKCEAETDQNVAVRDQGEVPSDGQAATKNTIIKRLLCASVVVILSTTICVFIAFLSEEKSVSMRKGVSESSGK
jgi:hypothetical protein